METFNVLKAEFHRRIRQSFDIREAKYTRAVVARTTKQRKIFTKVLPPTLPPVSTKTCLAVECIASIHVKLLPVLILDSNPTDPLLTCTRTETKVAPKTKPGNLEKRIHKCPAVRLAQDLPTPHSSYTHAQPEPPP